MSAPLIIRQGQSVPFVFDRGIESIEGWVCTIHVKEFKGDASAITRVITPDANDKWTGFLTSTETDALNLGMYRIVALITDAATDEEEQDIVRFNLVTKWA